MTIFNVLNNFFCFYFVNLYLLVWPTSTLEVATSKYVTGYCKTILAVRLQIVEAIKHNFVQITSAHSPVTNTVMFVANLSVVVWWRGRTLLSGFALMDGKIETEKGWLKPYYYPSSLLQIYVKVRTQEWSFFSKK